MNTTMRTLLATLLLAASGATLGGCPPESMTTAHLQQLKTSQWSVPDDARRQHLALALLDCLAAPDPQLRDELAFEALQTWMRSERLDLATVHAIRSTLLARLRSPDPDGFGAPFAALVLAEVARIDRRKPFLTAEQRHALVQDGAAFLENVSDYRGFDARAGWRHGVAHGADLMLQLSLNDALTREDMLRMLEAIARQVAPASGHFYIYGEGERLMAPVFYLARRDALSEADWDAWFARLLARYDGKPPVTQASLAMRHNLNAFLLALYASLQESPDLGRRTRMLGGVTKALKRLD